MIDEKNFYLFGRNHQTCDFVVDHGSCSRWSLEIVTTFDVRGITSVIKNIAGFMLLWSGTNTWREVFLLILEAVRPQILDDLILLEIIYLSILQHTGHISAIFGWRRTSQLNCQLTLYSVLGSRREGIAGQSNVEVTALRLDITKFSPGMWWGKGPKIDTNQSWMNWKRQVWAD